MSKEYTTKKKYKIVQVWRHFSKVHQIVTKDIQDKSCYTISVVVLNSFWRNLKKIVKQKKKKIKKGEQDDDTIAQAAASSLLALVNGLDKSNNFNQLNEMQIHMSKTYYWAGRKGGNIQQKGFWDHQSVGGKKWARRISIFKLIRRWHICNTNRSKETKNLGNW
jgi:hypothetical protein